MFRKYCCIKQKELKDCRCACLATICKQYGSKVSIYKIREIAKCVVSQNSDSDRYRLVFGWKQLITAKLFDKDIDVYIFNGSKDELIEKLSVD